MSPLGRGVEAAPGSSPAQSQETYLGYARAGTFVSGGGAVHDKAHAYVMTTPRRTDQWSLEGNWSVERERVILMRANGRIAFRFHARDLHLVLGPVDDGKPVRFRVTVDGKPPLEEHGTDTDVQGNGTVDVHRLYQLVRQATSDRARLFEIIFEDPGAQAYVFTFG